MRAAQPQEVGRHSSGAAFTLVEIVVSLTIITVIAAVAIPTIKGLRREEQTTAPMRSLAALAQEVRARALHERRPYEIVFEREGIHACELGFPDEKRDDFLKHLEERRTPPKDVEIVRDEPVREEVKTTEPARSERPSWQNGQPLPVAPASTAAPEPKPVWIPPWTVSMPLPEKSEVSFLLWGDAEWDVVEGDEVARWIFQPTGVVSPARVRLRVGDLEMETSFDALTAEVLSERLGPVTTLP